MIKKVRIAVDHVKIGFLIKEIKRRMIDFLSLLYLQS